MTPLSAFGLLAVTAMLVCYAFEDRSPWFVLGFALACVLGSLQVDANDREISDERSARHRVSRGDPHWRFSNTERAVERASRSCQRQARRRQTRLRDALAASVATDWPGHYPSSPPRLLSS